MDATITALPIADTTPNAPKRAEGAPIARRPTRKAAKPKCADCFFFQNALCALEQKQPCPTFRAAHPDGLQPPRQLSFAFRADRRTLPNAPFN